MNDEQLFALAQSLKQQADKVKEDEAAAKMAANRSRIQKETEVAQEEFRKLALAEGSAASFKLPTPAPPVFKTIVNVAKMLREEVMFKLTANGFYMRHMDLSHFSLGEISIPTGAFEHFFFEGEKAQKEQELKFGVRVEDLENLTGHMDRKDEITCHVAGEFLNISFKNGVKREYNIPLIETINGEDPLPKIEFRAKVIIVRSTLLSVLEKATATGDQVKIRVTEKGVEFSNKTDAGNFQAELEKNGVDIVRLETPRPQSAYYNLEYLITFLKAVKTAQTETVTLEMTTQYPIRLTVPLLDELSDAKAYYWMAPRVRDDMEDLNPDQIAAIEEQKKRSPAAPAPAAPEKKPEPAPAKPVNKTKPKQKK